MADTLGHSIFLKPDDVVRAFETRGTLQPTVRWSEMMHDNHAVAFTVAKIAKLDLLRQVQSSIGDMIRDGGTFEGWKAAILPELRKAGWWGSVSNAALTGTDETIIVNSRRLTTIYDTNVRMSMASGHWARIQRQKDVFPYLRYLPSTAEHKRPLHKQWYGILLPVDHPFWQKHFPPNGWFCQCGFEQVSERKMRKMGWTVTPDADLPQDSQAFTDAVGRTFDVPAGIDPGFSYNPGTAHLRAVANKATASISSALDAGLDGEAQSTLREIVADAAFDQFMARPVGVFPVAILTAQQQALIGAPSRLTVMPAGVLNKQLGSVPGFDGHPDLSVDDYRSLPDIIANALFIGRYPDQPDDTRIVFFKGANGQYYKAVVRQEPNDPMPIIVSFHTLRKRSVRQQADKLDALLDNRSSGDW